MYQFVEDLKEEQYKNFIQSKNLQQKNIKSQNDFYIGVAKDRKLVACCRAFIQIENRKKILSIPLGIQTAIEEEELYLFFKKYLLITAKKIETQKIRIYSKKNLFLEKIGFAPIRKNSHSYLPLKKEKRKEIPEYFKIVEMDTERKRKKLKEVKQSNIDLFLFNNVTFYTLQLDLYTYLDILENENEKKKIQSLIEEIGDSLILESISIEFFNEQEAQYIESETYSTLFEEKKDTILFEKVKEQLIQRGIKKLFFTNVENSFLPLEQEFIEEYEYNIYHISNLLKKGRD